MSMTGNIYGLDVKRGPKAIEINGVNFGTHFYSFEESRDYYEKFAKALAEHNDGPIFFGAYEDFNLNIDGRKERIRKEMESKKRRLEYLDSVLEGHFSIDTSWIDDLRDYRLKSAEKEPKNEWKYYKEGAREAGVPMFFYKRIISREDEFEFELINEKTVRIDKDDVGAIFGSSSTVKHLDQDEKHFLNSRMIEKTLDYKPSFQFMLDLAYLEKESDEGWAMDLIESFPEAVTVGLGVGRYSDLEEWLNLLKEEGDDKVVKKRGGSYCGAGVSIMDIDRTIQGIQEYKDCENGMDWIGRIAPNLDNLLFYDLFTVYERFHDSEPIISNDTGKRHDGCARVAVYSPEDADPIVLDGQWRLSPTPVDGGEDLNQTHRVNMSRGAMAQPFNDRDREEIFDFSKDVIKNFERAEENMENFIEGQRFIDNKNEIKSALWYFETMLTNSSIEDIISLALAGQEGSGVELEIVED
ncbi:MAG: hypothetical protein ABEK36_05925 [Candidatus Aenigmatarchaeota archaeon]